MKTSQPSLDNPAERAIGVLIVDDHPVAREGLRRVLEHDPALRVLGEAVSGIEAITQSQRLRPQVLLLDLSLPDRDGIGVTATIRRELPATQVVVLTDVLTATAVTQTLQAGVRGYLFKDAPPDEIRAAIHDVVAGRTHLSAQVTELLVSQLQSAGPPDPLSQREGEVVQLLAAGCSNQEIRQRLHLSEATVKTHVRHILAKLGASSRTQAVLEAMRLGLVCVPS